MSNTLDQWEAEAKKDFDQWQRHNECGDDCTDMQIESKRILALIDLIRKKDEAIQAMLTRNSIFETEAKMAREALTLTESLK